LTFQRPNKFNVIITNKRSKIGSLDVFYLKRSFKLIKFNKKGIEYHALTIKDNVDAKDDGNQVKLFIDAADIINKLMKKV
jgi:hypothetical protein